MSRRNKFKLERLRMYLRKNVFSAHFPVRNLIVVMASFAIVFMGVIAFSSLNNAKSGDKKGADSETLSVAGVSVAEVSKDETAVAADEKTVVKADATKNVKETPINKSAVSVSTVAESKYDMTGKFIVIEDLLNVRREADENSDVLGMIAKGTIGEVVKADGVWTEIKTDTVSGFVKSEYILTGEKASEMAELFDKNPDLLAPSGDKSVDDNDDSQDKDDDTSDEDTTEEDTSDDNSDQDTSDDTEEITTTEEVTEEVTIKPIPESQIPPASLLREFLGGSTFEY